MTLKGEVNGLILNIHNELIALDIPITLKWGMKFGMEQNLGLPFLHERFETRIAAIATSKNVPCGVFLRVQNWCQVSITLL